MRTVLTALIFPLLVTIAGTNSNFQYGDVCNPSIQKPPITAEKVFKLEREVKLVPSNFACTKQKWYVRLLGVFFIFFPFIFHPFSSDLEVISYAGGPDYKREQILRAIGKQLLLYILICNGIYFLLGLLFKIAIFQYTILTYERCMNLIVWLIP